MKESPLSAGCRRPRRVLGLASVLVDVQRIFEAMRRANEEGEIVWRVAVDSDGVPDSSSVSVVRSSSSDLVVAVRRAAPYLRFAPQPGRTPIVVELPATFQLNR